MSKHNHKTSNTKTYSGGQTFTYADINVIMKTNIMATLCHEIGAQGFLFYLF